MSLFVIDASVAVKLYVPEVHSRQAIRFFSDKHKLIAPDLMLAEFGNVVWKKAVLLGELTAEESERIMAAVLELPIEYYSTTSLLPDALQTALETKRTLYDSLYIALAELHACQFMTDDRKLSQSLQSTSLTSVLTLIENY